jgi:decaprenyl-diphosphate synthase subunit 1
VTIEMSQILHQLVMGELQQMAKVSEDKVDRYQQYIDKTFNKTASLMAHACR